MRANQIRKSDIVPLICTKSFSKAFKNKWGIKVEPQMRKGWTTWANSSQYSEREAENCLVLEDNEFQINFPPQNFKKIE
tara:strand:- start:59990 stop:60226 length:237 start_codon:yes stop_codon:yes gene_type:complete